MAKRRSYEHGGNHGGNPNGGSEEMTPEMVSLWRLLTKLQNQKSEKEGYEQADFDDSLFGPQDTITPEAQFKGANGGRMYEHGGTHPTEEEKERREHSTETAARKKAADEAFKDFSKNDTGKPLTQAQADIVFNQWPEDARKLGMQMLDNGLLSRESLVAVARGGKPLNLEGFNKLALKNGDASKGYGIENVLPKRRRFLKNELKDAETNPDGVRNKLIEMGIPVPGTPIKKVSTNSFTVGPGSIKYYGPKPETEYDIPEEVIEEDEVVEEVVEEEPGDMEVVKKVPPRIIKKEIPKEIEEEPEVVEEEVPATTPRPNFGAMPDLGVTERSDRLGRGDLPTQSEMGLYGEDARPIGGGIKLIEKPTNEKGGKLYAQGGKQMSPALMAYLKKYQRKFARGGHYRVIR